MNAILLLRVSTLDQDSNPQKDDLTAYAKKKGFTNFHTIETKESGLANLQNRLGLEELKEFIRQNNDFKNLFITELSRLGRRQSVLHETREFLDENQVTLHIKDNQISSDDKSGVFNIVFTIYGNMAESEIKVKKERFNRAKILYKKSGYFMGGKRLFGYDIQETEKKRKIYIPHPVESQIVKKIFDWYLNGFGTLEKNPSIKKISMFCLEEGFPKYTHSKRNINKLLHEAAYTGFKVTSSKYFKQEFTLSGRKKTQVLINSEMRYPELIDIEVFSKVQDKLTSKNINSEKPTVHVTLLSKKIRCMTCGNFFNADYRKEMRYNKNNYRCSSRTRTLGCANKQTLGMVMCDSVIWQTIISKIDLLSNIIKNSDEGEQQLKSRISRLMIKKDELSDKIKIHDNKRIQALNSGLLGNESLIDALSNKIHAFSKEEIKIQQEIDKRQGEIARLRVHNNNGDFLLNEILNISRDKILLKKYIDIFIEEVNILFQSKKFTLLRIKSRNRVDNVIDSLENVNLTVPEIADDIIVSFPNVILIDKRNTNNIKFIAFRESTYFSKYMYGEKMGFVKLLLEDCTFVESCEIMSFEDIFDSFEKKKNSDYTALNKCDLNQLIKLKIY